jgi:hypothetical protein
MRVDFAHFVCPSSAIKCAYIQAKYAPALGSSASVNLNSPRNMLSSSTDTAVAAAIGAARTQKKVRITITVLCGVLRFFTDKPRGDSTSDAQRERVETILLLSH